MCTGKGNPCGACPLAYRGLDCLPTWVALTNCKSLFWWSPVCGLPPAIPSLLCLASSTTQLPLQIKDKPIVKTISWKKTDVFTCLGIVFSENLPTKGEKVTLRWKLLLLDVLALRLTQQLSLVIQNPLATNIFFLVLRFLPLCFSSQSKIRPFSVYLKEGPSGVNWQVQRENGYSFLNSHFKWTGKLKTQEGCVFGSDLHRRGVNLPAPPMLLCSVFSKVIICLFVFLFVFKLQRNSILLRLFTHIHTLWYLGLDDMPWKFTFW